MKDLRGYRFGFRLRQSVGGDVTAEVSVLEVLHCDVGRVRVVIPAEE